MIDDDAPRGNIVSRRDAVAMLGLFGAGLMTRCAPLEARAAQTTPDCIVRPEQTAGPFFVEAMPQRSDIRAGRPGVPLHLTLNLSQLTNDGCAPLEGARVDVWHCDANGEYSDETFLRGFQLTDPLGVATFTTIYPGWYPGRTVHLHFKIRSKSSDFASQLYFDDAITDRVHARDPYARQGQRRTRNERDDLWQGGGDQLMLKLASLGTAFTSTFHIALH